MIAALVGMEVVTATVSELAGLQVTFQVALFTILGAIAVNSLWKIFYSYFEGSERFARYIALGIGISYIAGLATVVAL